MKCVTAKSCVVRIGALCALLLLAIVTAATSAASCVTELSRIVRTTQGRVKGPRGEAISGSRVTVTSSAGDEIFQTKSRSDGSLRLASGVSQSQLCSTSKARLLRETRLQLRNRTQSEPLRSALFGLPRALSGEQITTNARTQLHFENPGTRARCQSHSSASTKELCKGAP